MEPTKADRRAAEEYADKAHRCVRDIQWVMTRMTYLDAKLDERERLAVRVESKEFFCEQGGVANFHLIAEDIRRGPQS